MTERGRELQHRTTRELDEALYWVALDATFALVMRRSWVRIP
ncbi:immunity protein 63 of polymorphic toxin system [Streptomyces sp. TLI_171]|nr:immunity protein 63 of polymorphic toxin system [Streptomyces sp. TLI_171]